MLNIFVDPPSFPDQTITTANHDAMLNSAKFLQAISAYPDSQLAKDYQMAVSQASDNVSNRADGSSNSSKNVADSIGAGVNQCVFKGTKSYQNVTLETIVGH